MQAKRGYVSEDVSNFSSASLEILRLASKHVFYLINEGYGLKQSVTFVGNHFLLSNRQRLAIMRSVAAQSHIQERKQKEIQYDHLRGNTVWIDGFNQIITLEVLFSHSILLQCMDGTIRDLAGLHGTYRLIKETDTAIDTLFSILQEIGVRKVNILLDEPVSNSGRLKQRLADIAEMYTFLLDIQILKRVDSVLFGKECVITSDSLILDNCVSWFNLTGICLKTKKGRVIQVW